MSQELSDTAGIVPSIITGISKQEFCQLMAKTSYEIQEPIDLLSFELPYCSDCGTIFKGIKEILKEVSYKSADSISSVVTLSEVLFLLSPEETAALVHQRSSETIDLLDELDKCYSCPGCPNYIVLQFVKELFAPLAH